MIHLRLVVPPAEVEEILALLRESDAVVNIVHLPGVALKPAGDLVLCDVAREEGSYILARLRETGLESSGSIAVETVDTAISDVAREAERAAPGAPSDAVVWEEVEARTSESAELSLSFLAFMVIATMIAGVGIVTDSLILIIGAMVVGPEFGPVAGICVAAVQRRLDLARRSFVALAVGFPLAIATTLLATLLARVADLGPEELHTDVRAVTLFISHPDTFTVVVALLAGVAGVLSLTSAKSGALIGVLISVTTIPAAANVGVASAYGDWNELRGAAAQLGINLGVIIVAGTATLRLQRLNYTRRVRSLP